MRRCINLICWLLIFPMSIFSQSRTITGTITGSNGVPIPFATIKVKNSSSSTTASESGGFSINVTGSSVVLEVSSAGFATREINAGNASALDVQLQESG